MKVLIVDDEKIIRTGLMSIIDWDELGFTEVRDASSGQNALEIMHSYTPDLVLADIFMPGMSGLEFSKVVRNQYPDTKIVILTGYENFEYAKTAIEVGVSNYLVKPVFPEELYETVKLLGDQITSGRQLQSHIQDIETSLDKYRLLAMEKYWTDLVLGSGFVEEVLNEMLLVKGKEANLYCMAIEVINIEQIRSVFGSGYVRDIYNSIQKTAKELLGSNLVYVVNASPEVQYYVLQGEVENSRLMQLQQAIREVQQMSIIIGIGTAYDNPSNLKMSASQASEVLKFQKMVGQQAILRFQEMATWSSRNLDYPYEQEKKILHILQFSDTIDESVIIAFFQELWSQMPSPASLHFMYLQLLGSVYHLFGDHVDDAGGMPFFYESYRDVSQLESGEAVVAFFIDLCTRFIKVRNDALKHNVNALVEQAKDVIHNRFRDSELSISAIAASLSITPNYLSRIFHKVQGTTCVEYLTEVRMEQAKQFLGSSTMKSYRISEACGFSNPHYFSSLFKRKTGLSPTEYRLKFYGGEPGKRVSCRFGNR